MRHEKKFKVKAAIILSSCLTVKNRHVSAFSPIGHSSFPPISRVDNVQLSLNVKRPKKSNIDIGDDKLKKRKGFRAEDNIIDYQQGSMDTALCIIPPDEAWDDIQRARHFAKDPSFYLWPPAIRLFHPFVERSSITEIASSIAEVVEKYDLESFDITIDKLLIVPHFEELQKHEEAQKALPTQAETDEETLTEDEKSVQNLIKSEEQKGKRKLAKRKAKERGIKKETQTDDESKEDVSSTKSSKDQSPRDKLKEQRKSMSEFNGPCVLCLEPNEESKIHIQAFREILRKKLFARYDPFSISSSVTDDDLLQSGLPRSVLRQHGLLKSTSKPKKRRDGVTFRPTITIGQFSTVTKAVEIAKKLQTVWEPLSFSVTDLQMLSKLDPSNTKSDPDDISASIDSSDPYTINVDSDGNPSLHENRELSLRKFHGSDGSESILSTKGEYGCDAMIMLKGEEHLLLSNPEPEEELDLNFDEEDEKPTNPYHLEEEDEDKIMELLLSPAAIPGGQSSINGARSSKSDIDDEVDEDYLQSWLDEEEEDVDDGATIIIGRTQFFMGEMRQYTGMPASSTMDGKDRVMSDSQVSGSARRRGAVHRQGDRWQEGDFGRKEKDYLP